VIVQGRENPKSAAGRAKLNFANVPPLAQLYDAAAHDCGAIKYDPYNWREIPILASVYIAAIERHLGAYKAGQTMDDGPGGSGLPHMAMIRANAAILIDAERMGVLTDDRPKTPGYEEVAHALAVRKAQWMADEAARRRAEEAPYSEALDARKSGTGQPALLASATRSSLGELDG
jgi:hypothetical protein